MDNLDGSVFTVESSKKSKPHTFLRKRCESSFLSKELSALGSTRRNNLSKNQPLFSYYDARKT